nr:protein mor1 [Ipomoea trifida]
MVMAKFYCNPVTKPGIAMISPFTTKKFQSKHFITARAFAILSASLHEMSLEEIERKLRSVIQAKTISKLKSSAGKDRIEAIVSFKEQVKALPQLDKSAEILIGFLSAVPGWTETNVQVQQQVIDVITYIASKASKLPEICVVLCLQGIVERVADIKTLAQARKCLTTFCEAVGPGFVFERLYAIMKEHKNPKVLSEGILWMVTAVYAFGISSLRLKDLIDFCKEIGLKSSVAAIRNATIKLVETLHNFVGPFLQLEFSSFFCLLIHVIELIHHVVFSLQGVLTYILEECLSDNRILMRQYTLSTLDSWIVAVHLEEMVPYISTALTDDSKMGADWRKDLFYWLFRQPAAFCCISYEVDKDYYPGHGCPR